VNFSQHRDTVAHLGLWWVEAALKIGAASIFVCLLLLSTPSAGLENVPTDEEPSDGVRSLEVGHAIDAQLTTGQEHVYGFLLSSGQFLRFRVAAENPGSNLQVTLFDPMNREIEELSGPVCPFSLSLMLADSGTYRLRVQLLRSDTSPENYRVQMDELHEATERDRMRVAASHALVEAYRLNDSPDSRPLVVQKSEEAISLFHAADDHRGEAEVFQVLSFRSFVARDYRAAGRLSSTRASVVARLG
jgi:hypothetical protein